MSSSAVHEQQQARLRTSAKTVDVHPLADSKSKDEVSPQEDILKRAKTYGRTPDGTVFTVPTTHDMVSQLLDPRQPKNLSDIFVLVILALHIIAAVALPESLKRPVFALTFLFWRASYNIGIGILLTIQSRYQRLVTYARRWKLFENPENGNQPRPWLYRLLKNELEAKIPEDYDFEKAPIEYNTWLVFRRVVDLILMCDFASYCLFAVVCSRVPDGESGLFGLGRWGLGIALVGFNLWVKLDAHRVVKDYAWYWGDFFYLVDQELTFDGVFEMAPHPMYSIGYAGYYGISMMAASYEVLFISIVAHLAQMAFLVIVENPHIEKTYNPPAPRVRSASQPPPTDRNSASDSSSENNAVSDAPQMSAFSRLHSPNDLHHLIGWKNFDLYRSTDYFVVLLAFYMITLTFATSNSQLVKTLFVAHAFFWRIWYVAGLGLILRAQSEKKAWTRHFLKYGDDISEAWRQWKSLSHISMHLCYLSFFAACWKLYSPPTDWSIGFVLLKHVLGCGLIALQAWTAFSVYDSLGEFGWFFGDFFYAQEAKLTYKSIYRFLNNPERILGTAGIWGAALITWSRTIFIMALITQILVLGSINFVEKPHMQKIYGQTLRNEAGLTKFIRKSLPPVGTIQKSVDKAMDETVNFVAEFLAFARPKLASGVNEIVKESSALFNAYPARLTVTRLPDDKFSGQSPALYSLEVNGTPCDEDINEPVSDAGEKALTLEYGAPIRVKWTAPATHDSRDWIGLYRVTDNKSRLVTQVPSAGRWSPVAPGHYDAVFSDRGILSPPTPMTTKDHEIPMVSGEVIFEGDRLFWNQGVYEFRYHHAGAHNVITLSHPFTVRVPRPSPTLLSSRPALAPFLLPIVQNCLEHDPDISPATIYEPFGGAVERDGKYAQRVVYAIVKMFGIEFAPEVVPRDGCVDALASRIWNAREVLRVWRGGKGGGEVTPEVQDGDVLG